MVYNYRANALEHIILVIPMHTTTHRSNTIYTVSIVLCLKRDKMLVFILQNAHVQVMAKSMFVYMYALSSHSCKTSIKQEVYSLIDQQIIIITSSCARFARTTTFISPLNALYEPLQTLVRAWPAPPREEGQGNAPYQSCGSGM